MFLYSRRGCKPCQEAEHSLAAIVKEFDVQLRVIKIDEDYELQQRYGARVPVLESGGEIIAETHIAGATVVKWLSGRRI